MRINTTPLKAIRKKCLDCSGFSPLEVKLCPITECPLYLYRFGRNPARAGMCGTLHTLKEKPCVERKEIGKDEA